MTNRASTVYGHRLWASLFIDLECPVLVFTLTFAACLDYVMNVEVWCGLLRTTWNLFWHLYEHGIIDRIQFLR